VASVQVARRRDRAPEQTTSHKTDILFTFVLEGTMTLRAQGHDSHDLTAGDAFVIPPDTRTAYANRSSDLELLEVSLPGSFETITHD
jgi:quercetin dioxygenase-like cupin family protein